jgi:cell division protein FtsW
MAIGKKRIDVVLAAAIVAAVVFGIVMIYSASVIIGYNTYSDPQYFFKRQIIWAILGLIAMIITANVDYRSWKKYAGIMLGVTFVLLMSVFIFRTKINGAHRWISLGSSLTFQPSELAKFSMLVYLSAWLVKQREKIGSFRHTFLPYLGLVVAFGVLMLLEPDFGTFSIMAAMAVGIYFLAGMTFQQMVAMGAAIVAGVTVILIEPYRRARLTTFFTSNVDTSKLAADYHIKNILIAIGSGGWFGLGYGNSGQKRLFLPEPHTDSIYAIIVEELGFVTGIALVLFYVFFLWRGFRIVMRTEDLFGKLMAAGLTMWIGFQAFINLASMLHLIPLTGVPLPFISYGGTNLLISMAAMGVLLNISREATGDAKPEKPAVKQRGK